jgi:hypothetical protein
MDGGGDLLSLAFQGSSRSSTPMSQAKARPHSTVRLY